MNRTRKVLVGAAALGLVVTAVPVALAAANPATHHTGCLSTAKGTIAKIKVGDAPLSACSTGETEIQVAGGDITAVKAGTGLTGGASTGEATLSLAPNFTMPQGCSAGQVVKRSASGWYCTGDLGKLLVTTPAVTADDIFSADASCEDYIADPYEPYFPPSQTTVKSANFTVPLGTFLPTPGPSFRWFVGRTQDFGDGETFAGGGVKLEIVQTLSGTETVVSRWGRGESEDLNGAGIPWNQDFAAFTALPGATYHVRAIASAMECSRAQVRDAALNLVAVG